MQPKLHRSGTFAICLANEPSGLQHENGGRHLLIGWDIAVSNGESLQSIGDPEELLQWIRREYGHGSPAAWTTHLSVRPPRNYPKSWHDEDTILGDFLRAAEKHRKADGRELNLLPFTEESFSNGHPGITGTTAKSVGRGFRIESNGRARSSNIAGC